ncbi:DUF7159 family protein [Mycobacterium sp. LTG2003]
MDLVLGLAMTSRAVRWVLVDGTTGEGDPVDRGAITIDDVETYDPAGLLKGLVEDTETTGSRLHAIGVTWTADAAPLAGHVLQCLEDRGFGNVVAVSEVEAAGILASGIAEIAGYDEIAVCIVESDAAVAATVTADAVSADRIERSPADTTAAELIDNIKAVLEESTGGHTDAIFVLGSEGDESIVAALTDMATVPVISAAEADLAYARGAGLAAALAVNTPADSTRSKWGLHLTKVGALTSVLAAAVVTFVVATSAAVGIKLNPGAVAPSAAEVANVSEPAPAARPQPAPKAVPEPRPAPPAAKPSPAPPAAKPPAPEPAAPAPAPAPVAEVDNAPAYSPPEYVPPAPAPDPVYVPPPPPPAFVPPPAPPPVTYPQPRLRDRIIERIPIINRFHEPKPWG